MSAVEILERQPLRRFHYVLLAIASFAYGLTAMNVMLIAVTLQEISVEWSLEWPARALLASIGYVGMFFGAILSGFISDKIGRKPTLLAMILIGSIFTGLCGVAPNYETMLLLRLVAGFGLGGTLPTPGVYMSEYPPARYRGRFVGLVETSWVYGVIIGVLFAYIWIPQYGWRMAFNIAYLPLFLIPPILIYLPESIRFLEKKNRIDEVKKIFSKFKLVEDAERLELNPQPVLRAPIAKLFSEDYMKRTLILWVLWATLVYTYHGIFVWLPSIYAILAQIKRALELYMVVTLVQVPGYYSAALLLDKVGRKPIISIYLILAGIGCLLLPTAKDLNTALIYSCVISFFNLGAWAGLYTYTPELYPTELRGSGAGIAASIGRLAGIAGVYMPGYLIGIVKEGIFYTFLIFSLLHIIAGALTGVFGEETKGRRLEEISRIA